MEKRKRFAMITSTLGVFLIILGVSYSFFNYTRTGVSNTIKVGRIAFNSNQSNTVTLLNVFPIDKSDVNDSTDVAMVNVDIKGDTTYDEGVEYVLTVSNLTNTVGSKEIPIDVEVIGYQIGTNDEDYFDNRGGNSSIYKVLKTGTIKNNDQLLVGYITKGQTGIDGNVTIKAYLDKDKIAISDTYPEGDVTHTEGVEPNQTTVTDYTNGTTEEWANGRTILTTSEWNSLQTNGVSFQVKVEANEGVWVENPIKPICKRVTNVSQLHTEECSNISDYCYGDGYTGNNSTIVYGNAKSVGTTLDVGDAFDCDVNGDGNYSERFYYVSPYFNTDTLNFDDENGYATLIYYSNTYNGLASDTNASYHTTDNWHGPVNAITHLPTSASWRNITLKNEVRTIFAENYTIHNSLVTNNGNKTIENPFSYSGYGARLLSAQELMNACNLTQLGKYEFGELSNCNFLFEKTDYNNLHNGIEGIYLENPNGNDYVWYLQSMHRYVDTISVNGTTIGVRPVIDVPYNRIDY